MILIALLVFFCSCCIFSWSVVLAFPHACDYNCMICVDEARQSTMFSMSQLVVNLYFYLIYHAYRALPILLAMCVMVDRVRYLRKTHLFYAFIQS